MRATITVGTAKAAALDVVRNDGLAVSVAGKTGTAEYCDNIAYPKGLCVQGAWPAHAWFTGYAPWDDPNNSTDINDKPEILVVAFIYNGKEGSTAALPVARNVLQAYYRIQKERQDSGTQTTSNQVVLGQP
jgi:penicillin-binding protein 2